MATNYNPRTVTDGLVLNYDFGNIQKAFGTTNLITNTGLSVYNNVPSHVTATITQTSETYKQSPVWALTLTPTTSTGVSYLTSANNPGIGVVTGGGGGTGGVYTGHSIFFKSSVPLYGPAPIYTHYSNIAGWQSVGNYDDMGDGWYRANVIWYDTVTRSDGKYWAINPASATLNVPMTIYWAAPFKESQNYSSFVSSYASNTRGSGSGVVNLVSQSDTGGALTNGPTYSTANGGSFSFDGTNDYVQLPITGTYTKISFDFWGFFDDATLSATSRDESAFGDWNSNRVHFGTRWSVGMHFNVNGVWQTTPTTNLRYGWNHYSLIYDTVSDQKLVYLNGILSSSNVTNGSMVLGDFKLGVATVLNAYYRGNISNFKIYNKGLTATEVSQNFNSLRSRFSI